MADNCMVPWNLIKDGLTLSPAPDTKFAKMWESCRQSSDSGLTYIFVYLLEQFECAQVSAVSYKVQYKVSVYQQFNILDMNRPVCILHTNNGEKQGRPLHSKQT